MNSEYRLPESTCLHCGKPVNGAGTPDGTPHRPPEDGDLAVCQCGCVMAYDAEGHLRGMRREEIDRVIGDVEFMRYLAKLVRTAHLVQAVHDNRN